MIDEDHLRSLKEALVRRGSSLSVAESLTSGRVQALLGSVSGASRFLRGGVTAYDIPRKVGLLKVDEAHAQQTNAISAQVAREMAAGVCDLFDSDLGVATTGYAEPCAEEGVEVPYAYLAVWQRGGAGEGRVLEEARVEGTPGMSRSEIQELVAEEAVLRLLRALDLTDADRVPSPGSVAPLESGTG